MTNDEFIKAVSDCNGNPACIALVLNNHIQGMIGNAQLDKMALRDVRRELADLIRHVAEHDELTQGNAKDRAALHEQLEQLEGRVEELQAPPPVPPPPPEEAAPQP